MEFVCYSDWNQLPNSADDLFLQGQRESLFFSRPWLENLTSTAFDQQQTLLFACVIDEQSVVAILPLVKLDDQTWGALKHNYSSLFSLLLAKENQTAILECLVQGLSDLPFQSLRLEPVGNDDVNINALQETMEAHGFICHRTFRFYNWIHSTNEESYTDYLAERPTKLRNTIKRKTRKLQREHGFDIRMYKDEEALEAMEDYYTAYHSSWKAKELYRPIIDGMVQRFAAFDWTRLGVLYIDDKPTAAQLWFVVEGKASIFRLAYDQQWKSYSPGSILTAYLMEYVIDTDKVTEIDFLTGNEIYKQDWMSERRERCGLVCINKPTQRNWLQRVLNRFSS